jgi:hypothetical protein
MGAELTGQGATEEFQFGFAHLLVHSDEAHIEYYSVQGNIVCLAFF